MALQAGQRIYPGQWHHERGVSLHYHADGGDLRVYAPDWILVWAIGGETEGPPWHYTDRPGHAELQRDGNIVCYDAAGVPYAATNTFAAQPRYELDRSGLRVQGFGTIKEWPFSLPTPEPGPGPGDLPTWLAERKVREQLRCDGDSFFSGVDAALPVACHAGDMLGQWATLPSKRDLIKRALDAQYAAGYAIDRCWVNIPPNPWWSDKPAPAWGIFETPGYDGHYDSFMHELRQRGLRIHLVPGGLDRNTLPQRLELYRWITERVAAMPTDYALVEGVNEAGATGAAHLRLEIEHEFIKPLVERTGVLGAISGYGGTESREILRAWTPDWMRFVYYHSYRKRDHLVDILRHHFSFMREDRVRRVAWSGEPTGHYFPAVTEGFTHVTAAGVGMLHVQTAMCRTLPCFMSSSGVIFDAPFESFPGFTTTPTAVARLPRDVHRFALTHGGASDAWVRAIGDGADLVRVDQAFNHDGRFVATAYSERKRATDLPVNGGAFSGVWYDGEGQAIADQRPTDAFRAPMTSPGCYFVGGRER